jgi:hypothetical protein
VPEALDASLAERLIAYDSEDTGSEMSEADESPVMRKNSYSSMTEEGIPMYVHSLLLLFFSLSLFFSPPLL